VAVIREGAGKQFDPDLVDGFLQIEAQFREIAQKFADPGSVAADATAVSAKREPEHQITPEQEQILISTLESQDADSTCEQKVAVMS
jgi:hypothetical protein